MLLYSYFFLSAQRNFNNRWNKNRSQPSGASNQAAALRAEGVTVSTDALGELSVDFSEFGWFPDVLPSEEGEEEGQDWHLDDEAR